MEDFINHKKVKRKEFYVYGRIIYDLINEKETISRVNNYFIKKNKKSILNNNTTRVKMNAIEIDTETKNKPKLKKELKKLLRFLKKRGIQDINAHIVIDGPKKKQKYYYKIINDKYKSQTPIKDTIITSFKLLIPILIIGILVIMYSHQEKIYSLISQYL